MVENSITYRLEHLHALYLLVSSQVEWMQSYHPTKAQQTLDDSIYVQSAQWATNMNIQ